MMNAKRLVAGLLNVPWQKSLEKVGPAWEDVASHTPCFKLVDNIQYVGTMTERSAIWDEMR